MGTDGMTARDWWTADSAAETRADLQRALEADCALRMAAAADDKIIIFRRPKRQPDPRGLIDG